MIKIIKMLYKIRNWTNEEIDRIQSECVHQPVQTDYRGDNSYDGYHESFTFTCTICDKKFYETRYK